LDHLCKECSLTPSQLTDLAHTLVSFFYSAAVARPAQRFGEPAWVAAPALENFEELFTLLPDEAQRLKALEAWTSAEAARCQATFARRKAEGRVREGHGDLHLGNLVLIDGRVTPFDGIEFNDDFRWNDVASEIAFTYIDLLDHRRADLAACFLNEWLTWSGDFGAAEVLPFYAVYRALVRAKIAGIRRDLAEAINYLDLAVRLITPPPPRLVITHGVSGSGKSRASAACLMADPAARTLRLRSDVERKRLFGFAPDAASEGRIYTLEANRRTYERLADLSEKLLAAGWSVIIDAAFLKRGERDAFHALARDLGIPFAILRCAAPVDELRRRLDARRNDPSEATVEVMEKQLEWIEPLAEEELAVVTYGASSDYPGPSFKLTP
ncbi:hypothetical protein EG831_08840, partial [bacterium]|nr:hypothetical protein [bacterium]